MDVPTAIVPRFYLERFTERGKFWVWDKLNGREFSTTPSSVAAAKYFYRVPELIGSKYDPQFLEKDFAYIEGIAASITKRWLKEIPTLQPNDKVTISNEERELMAFYIALQAYRTAEARDILAAFAEQHGPYKNGISQDEVVNLHGYFLERGMSYARKLVTA